MTAAGRLRSSSKAWAALRRGALGAVLLAAAAAAAAEPSALGPAGVDRELDRAEKAIGACERAAASGGASRPADLSAEACLKSFRPEQAFAAISATNSVVLAQAASYQGCLALAARSDQPCSAFSERSASGDQARVLCRRVRTQFTFVRTARSGAPEEKGACLDFLTNLVEAEPGTFFRRVPPQRYGAVCESFAGAPTKERVLDDVLAQTSGPSDPADKAQLLQIFDNLFFSREFRCGTCGQGFCCDSVALARAAREGGAKFCGRSVFCRAAYGDASACEDLREPLARSYCTSALDPSARREVQDAARARDACLTAAAATRAAVSDAEALDPSDGTDAAARRERARALSRRLDAASAARPARP